MEKKRKVYFICNITKGGTSKYIKDLIAGFPENEYIIIKNNKEFSNIKFKSNDLILLQQLLNTNINPLDIITIKLKYKIKLILCIHDFYWLSSNDKENHHIKYLENNKIKTVIIKLFNICDEVIHPTNFTFNIYGKYFNNKNFKIVNHNDIKLNNLNINIPKIFNNQINVGFLNYNLVTKGSEYVSKLTDLVHFYKKYEIKYYIINKNLKPYKENEYFDLLRELNIHCLLYLNKWGETWCYSLTKGLNSGLPILYNNFGSFKERINEKENYFKVYENEEENGDIIKLANRFIDLLNYIINNNGKIQGINDDLNIVYNDYYKNLLKKKSYLDNNE